MSRPNASASFVCMALVAFSGLCAAATTMPYKVNHDAPLNAELSVVAETPGVTQYRVVFNGIEGDRVPAFVYVPRDGKAKHPAILSQYGSGGSKKTDYIVFLDQQFAQRGFVVMTIDIPSKGERKSNQASAPFGPRFGQTLGDYGRAIDYLATRNDVDPNRSAYLGISWGAITGITYAAHDPRIKAVVSLVGGGNFTGWFPGPLDEESRRNAELYDPYYHVAMIAPRPLLLINVKRDQLIPLFFSESLHRAAGPGAQKVWLDTNHYFEGSDYAKLAAQAIDFVEGSLAGPATTRPTR
jgi:dienelactone hydrolase